MGGHGIATKGRPGSRIAPPDHTAAPTRRPAERSAGSSAAAGRLERYLIAGRSRGAGPRWPPLRPLGLARLRSPGPPPALRYERAHPGDLLHLDIKRLGRIRASATASPATVATAPAARVGVRPCGDGRL